jgi:hypothetical protein
MESKPKKRQVRKVRSVTQERPKSQTQNKFTGSFCEYPCEVCICDGSECGRNNKKPKSANPDKPTSAEALIKMNGELVEELFLSRPWTEIAMPLLQELIAGVSGRFTNGRYYHGSLTRDLSLNTGLYQKALMDFYNHLQDFIDTKNKVMNAKKEEALDKKAEVYNPFMEEQNED